MPSHSVQQPQTAAVWQFRSGSGQLAEHADDQVEDGAERAGQRGLAGGLDVGFGPPLADHVGFDQEDPVGGPRRGHAGSRSW